MQIVLIVSYNPNHTSFVKNSVQLTIINQFSRNLMGVHKLWDILLTIAVQQQIQDLSGLVLAIDASLWIVKINSIYQQIDDGLKCIFNKLLWLKKNNIRPIFVFDGDTPMLKRKTVQDRRNKRREVNSFDLQKKVQIEIIKNISGTQSQKTEQSSQYDSKAKQIDQMLANLLKYGQTTNTIQISEKMALQAEVLNKNYELYTEVNPKILNKFGDLDYFCNLDIESKQEILENVQESGMPTSRQIRSLKQKMSEQQKIMYEMELIKKKSKIRELQDNLYRKLTTKRIENGFEIIQGVYNGKKVVQKRKIKQKTFDEWAFVGSKKQTCNNFKQIFNNSRAVQKAEDKKEREKEEDEPNFFAKIFTKDYTKQKRESSQSSFSQLSKRLSEQSDQPKQAKVNKKQKQKQSISSDKLQNEEQSEQSQQLIYCNLFDVQPKRPSQSQPPKQNNENPDQFPDFIMMQSLDELCTSSHNLHLQNMLDILGITYIVAPFEAEAQCAALQQMGLVDGVITEDSDVFLFGARKVYRGVFQDNIKLYSMIKIQQKLLLTRQKLILFALMLGSDYTEGVKGIGIVNAMEILKVHHDIESLQKFTNWAKSADILQQNEEYKTEHMLQQAMSQDEIQFYKLHRKFKNYWHVHPSFPQRNVYEAYMQPPIQAGSQLQKKIKEKKSIEMEGLKKLMEQKFKMVPMQIELNVKIFSKPFERKVQSSISDYMGGGFARIASKRLQRAINLGANGNS